MVVQAVYYVVLVSVRQRELLYHRQIPWTMIQMHPKDHRRILIVHHFQVPFRSDQAYHRLDRLDMEIIYPLHYRVELQ